MKKSQSSISAQGIAFIRASESSKPAQERICDDPLARQMISPAFYLFCKLFAGIAEKRGPGVTGFLVARVRYIDDLLQACLADGTRQVVILGAGLDSRAYRFEQFKTGVPVFEVDHPASQQDKVSRVKRIFGSLPAHVTYLPVDFNTETLSKLFDVGYEAHQKTLFIWEGVTQYLTAAAVEATLAFIRQNAAPGSSVVFDYIYADALRAAHQRSEVVRMQRSRRFTGEGLTFGIEKGEIENFLTARGYTHIKNVTSQDLKAAYFNGVNQERAVAEVYAIVTAEVGSKG